MQSKPHVLERCTALSLPPCWVYTPHPSRLRVIGGSRFAQEREKNSWPYRVLATNDGYGDEERFVVLKREPNHFLLLSALMPPLTVAPPIDQSPGVAVGKHSAGGGSGTGGSGSGGVDRRPGDAPTASTTAAAAVAASKPRTVSCFRRSELPDVIRKLWEI